MTDPYRQTIDALARCKRVLLTTHVRPDGDALGTTAALALGLRHKGVDAEVLLLSHLPRKYAFVYQDHGIVHHDVEQGWPAGGFPFDRFDALLVADTGTWSQLPGLQERIANWRAPKLVLDHHLTQQDWADVKLVNTEAAAAAEVAAELLDAWGVPFDAAIATALYLGIATDTGWFMFANTRPYTLRLAARLMEAGVDTERIYQLLYQNERAERIALQTRAQQSLALLEGGRLATMRVRKADFEQTRAAVPDTENLINIPLQIRTVEASVLFVEQPEGGPVRVSLRSKGGIDVAKFAEQFGGGGHARASGLKLDAPFDDAYATVVAAIARAMPNPA
jgi:phosphoesterase RecJ-like protein